MVIRTFSKHFKYFMDWHIDGDNMILIGSVSPFTRSEKEIISAATSFNPSLQGFFRAVVDENALAQLPEGEINTDDRPVIEFHNARNIILGPETFRRTHKHRKI